MILTNKSNINRIAIYFFYDKDGIVDEYNLHLLNDLKKNITRLLVVCNGKLTSVGREKFLTIADDVLVRENVGFDVWAYKKGMEHIGWDELTQYDELVLLNFTNFGPIYPFKEAFDKLNSVDIDFWGITKHHGIPHDPYGKCKYGYIPEHIQSSFIVIRNHMLCSRDFQSYWGNMCEINDYADAICCHEAIFTKYFNEMGFRSKVYIETDDLKQYTDYPLMLYALELVKNRRCPVFKRKLFYNIYSEFLENSCGQPADELYHYIKDHTDYDVNMIWDSLLRTTNMSDIKNRMHLNYILPKQSLNHEKRQECKVALILHIYFEDLIEYCYNYAISMPKDADIYITTDSEKKRNLIFDKFSDIKNKLEVILIENRGRDVSALLVGCKHIVDKYDYICFAHDKKSLQVEPYSIGESFSYKCFENILASKNYVENVIYTFEKEPRLGLLAPPPPNHSVYYQTIGLEWGDNYDNTVSLAKTLQINLDIDQNKPPIAPLGTMFWFRAKAFKKLLDYNWQYKDFPQEPTREVDGNIMHAVERIYPFAVQSEGYYSGWLMSDAFAKIELTNLYVMLREVNIALFWNFGIHQRHYLIHLLSAINYDSNGHAVPVKVLLKILLKRILPEKCCRFLKQIKKIIKIYLQGVYR